MFEKLISSTNAYKIIKSEKSADKLSHAYLIVLDDEVLLRDTLKELAKMFFAESGKRRREELIDKELFADLCIYPKTDEKWSVSLTKQLLDEVIVKPIEENKKIFILDGVQNMSTICQNKLLKILEEPPQNVHFILGCTNEENVLQTVKSRSTKIQVQPFKDDVVYEFLVENYSGDGLKEIAYASNGRIGKAISLLSMGYKDIEDKAFDLATATSKSQVIKLVRNYAENTNATELFNILRLIYMDALFLSLKEKEKIHYKDRQSQLNCLKEYFDVGALLKCGEIISNAENSLKFNAPPVFELEKALTRILEENKKWKK